MSHNTSTYRRVSLQTCVCTVPYEGGNFANSEMDNFSLIFKTSLKIIGMFFYVNAKQGSKYIKVLKKLFKAKTTMYIKA